MRDEIIKKCLFALFLLILIPQISYANDIKEIDRKINFYLKNLLDIHSNLEKSSRFFVGRTVELKDKKIDDDNLFSTPYSRYHFIVNDLSEVDGVILNDIDFLKISTLIKDEYKTLYYSIAVKRLQVPQTIIFSDVLLKAIKCMTKDQNEIKHIDLIINDLISINNIYSNLINQLQTEVRK
jgi:hypothetical protein